MQQNQLTYPVHFFDFESQNPAIPRFDGLKPYEQFPFQYSCHVLHEGGQVEHREYLHTDTSDPRPSLIAALAADIAAIGSVIVYHQSFEVGSPRDGETEALVVLPTSQQCSLDFHLLREECQLDGLWFPFQLTYRDPEIGELVFVCDQDGSLCLYTHNFPWEILKRARKILKAIASKLYSQGAPDEGWYLSDDG